MKTAKIYFPNSEIRRLSACDKSFDDLVSFAAQTMPENNLEFSYLDNEHDFVVFTSQEEWQEAQKYHAEHVMRIYVKPKQSTSVLLRKRVCLLQMPHNDLFWHMAPPSPAS